MERVKKFINLLGVSMLLSSLALMPVNQAQAAEETVKEEISEAINSDIDENVSLDPSDISFEEEKIVLDITVEDEGIQDDTLSLEIPLEDEEELASSANSVTFSEGNADTDSEEYGVFFGTIEEKEALEQAFVEDAELLTKVENNEFTEEELDNLVLPSETYFENAKEMTAEELEYSPMTVTNLETNEVIEYTDETGVGSAAWVLPVGIYITRQVGARLLKTALAAVIGGFLGAALSVIASNIHYRRYYDHYRVRRSGNVGLTVLGGCNINTAVNIMKVHADVWSVNQVLARRVAIFSMHGKEPVLDPAHGRGNFRHYHSYKRILRAHSFFGVARAY